MLETTSTGFGNHKLTHIHATKQNRSWEKKANYTIGGYKARSDGVLVLTPSPDARSTTGKSKGRAGEKRRGAVILEPKWPKAKAKDIKYTEPLPKSTTLHPNTC